MPDTPFSLLNSCLPDASADGSVIVGRDGEAFYWTAAGGLRSLEDVLLNDYGIGSQLAGVSLLVVWDISDDGQVIIGWGRNATGEFGGWVVIIPEPSPLALTVAASIAVVFCCRRNHVR